MARAQARDVRELPLETVRDLLGITRTMHAAWKRESVPSPTLQEVKAIGDKLKLALRLWKTSPDNLGHANAHRFRHAFAPTLLRACGVESRVTIERGIFFETVPAGGDAYILSHVIHDWSEDQCLTVLGNCRKAMRPTSRLLLVELVLREGNAPGFGSADMVMMVFTGGEERTAREYEVLLARAGLKMTRVVPTASNVSIVEAAPA